MPHARDLLPRVGKRTSNRSPGGTSRLPTVSLPLQNLVSEFLTHMNRSWAIDDISSLIYIAICCMACFLLDSDVPKREFCSLLRMQPGFNECLLR